MTSKLYSGIDAFFESFRVLKDHSNIRNLALIPTFMSVVLLTTGLIAGVFYLNDILSWIMQKNVSDYSFVLKSLIYFAGFTLFAVGFYILVMVVVSFLSIPVCVVIAQKTLQLKGWKQPKKNLAQSVLSSARMMKVSFQKLFVFLLVSFALLITSFMPLIFPLSLYLSFMLIAFDSIDYSWELDELTFGQRIDFFQKNWLAMSGLSFCLMVLAIIPILHILFLPIAVISASVLYEKLLYKGLQ